MASKSKKKLRKLFKFSIIVYAAYLKLKDLKRKKRKRRWWVRDINKDRERSGFFESSFKVMREKDPEMFFKATRMTVDHFDALLNMLREHLEKQSIRKPISVECRLAATLIYLAHGGPRSIYAWKFKMGLSTFAKIMLETCEAIWSELAHIYLAPPNAAEWHQIAVDYNYKGRHSIVLLAACDANYCFTMVDIGSYGSQSDGGILQESIFGQQLIRDKLPIPNVDELPNSTVKFPYFFVGDAAFPLRRNLMRPYPGKNLSAEQEHFNKRISRARMTIENAFGIMASRWRVVRYDIHCIPSNVDKIVKAVCVLHNYLTLNSSRYCEESYVDRVVNGEIVPGAWRNESENLLSARVSIANNASRKAFHLQNTLSTYLFQNKIQ